MSAFEMIHVPIVEPSYFISLAIGALVGAWMLGSGRVAHERVLSLRDRECSMRC
jgi:hypothetical protein